MAVAKKPVAASIDNAVQSAMAPMNAMQEQVRESAERGIEQVRAQYEQVKDAAEKATGKLEESFNAAKAGTAKLNTRALELARANVNASFDHVQALFGATSVQDFVALNTEFAKSQIAALTEQTKELAALSQQAATDAAEPVKSALPFKR